MLMLAELVVTGIMIGGIYALIALGWTIIFKTSGVLNLATGEMALIGGYICLALYVAGVPFVLAVAGAVIVGVILGFGTERLVLRPMIGEAHLPIVMVTVGLAYSFRGIVQLIWGAATRVFTPAVFPLTPITVGPFSISQVFLWSFILSVVLMGFLILFFQRTRTGLAMQATADDETAAMSVGVSPKRVYGWSWALAFAVVGVGGALLGNINGLNVGVAFLGLLVLPAVVIGGLNSIPGAIVGGLIIGVLQNLGDFYISPFVPGIRDIFPFLVMMVVLLFRPYGLWGWVKIERM
ncbi:branched-chain amino acid ABC transporter permease [Dehalococcoidia bacterium]|nr:branched-chain amino acid ABC transporter permease [Dehalococcoidia bacterium]